MCYRFDEDNLCDFCGKARASRFHSNKYGTVKYCSFECKLMGQRNINLAFSLFFGIPSIGVFIYGLVAQTENQAVIIMSSLVMLVASIITFFMALSGMTAYKKYSRYKGRRFSVSEAVSSSRRLASREHFLPSDDVRPKSTTIYKPAPKVQPMIYRDATGDQICVVCKLLIDDDKQCLECPFCGCHFHIEHYTQWMKVNRTCPTCQNILEG